jgi:hypothetical protein
VVGFAFGWAGGDWVYVYVDWFIKGRVNVFGGYSGFFGQFAEGGLEKGCVGWFEVSSGEEPCSEGEVADEEDATRFVGEYGAGGDVAAGFLTARDVCAGADEGTGWRESGCFAGVGADVGGEGRGDVFCCDWQVITC